MILVPSATGWRRGGRYGGGYDRHSPPITANQKNQGWVFPFDKPSAPGDGNNQAMAINYTDNTVVYDAAFALVWATDGEDAMNVNEAHAYASCINCAAVAMAYQVVFVYWRRTSTTDKTQTTTWPCHRTWPVR